MPERSNVNDNYVAGLYGIEGLWAIDTEASVSIEMLIAQKVKL